MAELTTHTLYENFVLEAKLTDLLNTKLATRSLMTIDNSLSENVGMTKKINTYTYAGTVEKMATLGATNTVRGVLSYTTSTYLLNLNTREQIKINKTLSKGEVIRVNTNYGKKTVFGTVDGEETNYFSFLDLDSTFIQLEVGGNEFRWGADSNESNLEVNIIFSPKYLGV